MMANSRVPTLLPEITHGDHCCLFFSSPEEQGNVTAPFLALGLERGERSVFVGGEDEIEVVREALEAAGVNVESEQRKGRLMMNSQREYLEQGRFNPEKMLSFLQQTYDATLMEGYSALRAAGNVYWQVGPDQDYQEVVYYETLLDVFFLGKRMVGLCEYPKSKVPPETLSGILNTHRIAAIDRDICSNFHYVPPDLLLEKDAGVRQAKRVEWMTSQLLRAKRAEGEILRLNEHLEETVARRTEELSSANKELEAFSYSVSHDLRAPLRAIDGYARMVLEDYGDKLDAEGKRRLETVVGGARKMGLLIDDLLEFSRLGRRELHKSAFEPRILARDTLAEMLAAHPERKVESTIGPLPRAWGDPALIKQVFVNLLSNALKYSGGRDLARIEVGGSATATETLYWVKDNGVGFQPEYAHKLFKVFQRLHSDQQFEGTGVGLALVHRIVERHGGRVWAQGAPDQGATFTFSLPVKEGDPNGGA